MSGTEITVTDVAKAFDRRILFENVSFEVGPGAMTAITGPSGSGKSTLLNCLGLLEPVTAGAIRIAGEAVTSYGPRARRIFRRDTLGYLFQNYALIESASVAFNLEIAGRARGAARRPGALSPGEALGRVGLSGREAVPVYRLSGGEQQRVALARLLVRSPRVVLADEPTGALDDDNTEMVLASLQELASRGAAVVVATHSSRVVDVCNAEISMGTSFMGVHA
ncbi:ABC transporter ATP-binding protein [Oerskovia jenensis]|uniref:ABC transporter ATP-binding protein n=1 Tax=Oerskovia jenensis TaxID=162169 RepID=UPI0036DEE748